MEEVLVCKIMNPEVLTVEANCPLSTSLSLMTTHNAGCIVAVETDTSGHKIPIGILSESDAVEILAKLLTDSNMAEQTSLSLQDVMVTQLVTITETQTINDAFDLKRQHKTNHIPVTNNEGYLTGIISQTDLMLAHSQIIERQRSFMAKAVNDQTKELQEAYSHMQLHSAQDAMLDIGNRSAMEKDLKQIHATARRYDRPYSIAIIDVDYYAAFMKRNGSAESDNILKRIVIRIMNSTRQPDQLYRYNGEQLLILYPETNLDGAKIITDRIIESIENLNIVNQDSDFDVVTVSAGVADNLSGGICSDEWQDVVQRAEEGLALAVQNGRNQLGSAQLSFAEEISANLQREENNKEDGLPKH